MDISVIIVSYNTRQLLSHCLNSIEEAKQNLKIEIFVVDNNSHDKTTQMVKKDFRLVKLIANRENLGFSKANNIALKKARGKYILILNPDTTIDKNTLGTMFSYMEENTNVAMSTCRVQLINGQLDADCRRRFPTPWRAFTHFSKLSKIFPGTKLFDSYRYGDIDRNSEHEIEACVGAFMFIRTKVLEKIGYFDEDYFFYGEDLDLCYRFKMAGEKIFYTPRTKIIHYKGASSGIKSHSKHLSIATLKSKQKTLRESTRAMELFYKKHYQKIYPRLITYPVLLGIKAMEKFRLAKVK
ncbi:MAG: glycosyltransferase family 2 protein [Patescibacteria group bacterium]